MQVHVRARETVWRHLAAKIAKIELLKCEYRRFLRKWPKKEKSIEERKSTIGGRDSRLSVRSGINGHIEFPSHKFAKCYIKVWKT